MPSLSVGTIVNTSKPILLMTRPEKDAQRFVAGLARETQAACEVIFAPLLEIVSTQAEIDLESVNGVIFTSANAVSFVVQKTGKPAYCVGEQTTAAARDAGWDARYCGENADEFVKELSVLRPQGPLVHLSGSYQRGDIAQRLSEKGVSTGIIAVYIQRLRSLTPQARDALRGEVPVFVPLFSPRTAQQFASELSELGISAQNQVVAFALSGAIAQPLAGLRIAEVILALRPTAQMMRKAVEKRLR